MYSSYFRRVLLSTTAKARPRAVTAATRGMTSAVVRASGRRAGAWALGAVLLGSAVTCLYEPTHLLAKAKAPPAEPAKPVEVKQISEPNTGITFASVLPSDAKLKFVGCGCRKKYGIAKIYAVGIYVDSKPTGSSGDDMLDQVISSGKQKRAVLLKMYREVGPDQMIEALESSLKPRLSTDPAKPASPDALNSLAQLRAALSKLFGPKIKVGTEILFVIDASAKPTMHLTVAGAGPAQDLVAATDLSRALMDVYLSKTAVVPNLRADVAKALTTL